MPTGEPALVLAALFTGGLDAGRTVPAIARPRYSRAQDRPKRASALGRSTARMGEAT
jgi:hypothetical protein